MQLKFRAWDKKTKWMLKWSDILEGKTGNAWSFFMETLRGDNSRFTLMQYTGLLDKGEKEIYEGDVINIYRQIIDKVNEDATELIENIVVKWDYEQLSALFYDKIEVIGNIYENPELLKD